MIKVFSAITAFGVGDPTILAGGISEALITTAAGLSVGIPSLMFYRYFRGRVNALTVDMEQEAIRLVEVLQGERGEHWCPARGRASSRLVKFSDRKEDETLINLTPLIDVVFLLLIFFMVSTTFSKESQLRIKLPESSEDEVEQQEAKILEIEINSEGVYAVKGPDEDAARELLNASGQKRHCGVP